MITAATIPVLLGMAVLVGAAPASVFAAAQKNPASPWQMGIWKSAPIPGNPDAQFGKQDPFALAHGEHIHTDCSIYWIDPANSKLYCFNSGTSKEFFAQHPERYAKPARKVFQAQKAGKRPDQP